MRTIKTILLLFFIAQATWAETIVLKGEAVTGFNRLKGEIRYRYDFAPPPFDLTGAQMVDIYNPDSDTPIPLTRTAPDDAILASTVDPYLEKIFPGFDINSTDPGAINVPLREIDTWVTGDLATRATLPFRADADVVSRHQADPETPSPITLGDWLKASGKMKLVCGPDRNRVTIKVKNLIPNRVYTVWAMWLTAQTTTFPQPFGGVPNAYITDAKGRATFVRDLSFCPTRIGPAGFEGNRLMSIITHLHSDHILYGSLPVPLTGGRPPGTVLHTQLEWNFPGVGTRLIPRLNSTHRSATPMHPLDENQKPILDITTGVSKLSRKDAKIKVQIHTNDLNPGDAYTIWWNIKNYPDNPDLTTDSFVRADGQVVSRSGKLWLRTSLHKDDDSNVLTGPGLTDPRGAEINMVIRTHGAALPRGDQLDQQLGSAETGCNPICMNSQASEIHHP